MSAAPVICFGQQPCGIFPRRFLYSKFQTARRLQSEIGGRIVFFYHDSDHDPRETQTCLRHRKTGEPHTLNFAFENKLQRKYSPLYAKRVTSAWRDTTARQLPAYVPQCWTDAFRKTEAVNIADFCLEMYRHMGLLDGVEIVRSSSPDVRRAACDITDFFVDVPHEGEIVRARHNPSANSLQLHEGGNTFVTLPHSAGSWEKSQISPTRDSRLRWMQSVIHCTHYIAGLGEQAYLNKADAPEILFVTRDEIDRSDEAYTDVPV
ncbi:hypothetical protein CMV30_08610 [Nibricoccus aquaticus]|uniref:Uncharacterized protein n=1 Tax=Nibricoccus aquaticus TaxID=2576891 RepID=A0A290Q6F4_9BACT|nr:hypothetical protein [Nibricoccus aquaticus]ATC64003.1 hypothetical protein CMV30_08610 [Nibricoccus aquaticus]